MYKRDIEIYLRRRVPYRDICVVKAFWPLVKVTIETRLAKPRSELLVILCRQSQRTTPGEDCPKIVTAIHCPALEVIADQHCVMMHPTAFDKCKKVQNFGFHRLGCAVVERPISTIDHKNHILSPTPVATQ